jgi:TRAP-type C4-dicarboxylate transport system permease small subunit
VNPAPDPLALRVDPAPPGPLARIGTAIENGLLVLLLAAMMLLAVGQIVLRIFFDSGFIWADELVKNMVLWVALVASVAAARSGRHLRIDVLSHFVPERLARLPAVVVHLFAALVCGVIAWHSARYIGLTIQDGDKVLLDTPAWLVQGILPVAFLLMTWHFLVAGLKILVALVRSRPVTG